MSQSDENQFPFEVHRHRIIDDYQIFSNEVLGVGLTAKVIKCQNIHNGRICALKILKDGTKTRREIEMHKKAAQNCELIVEIIDIYSNICNGQRCLFIIMECMKGGQLLNKISSRQINSYTEAHAKKHFHMICKAVQHLHSINIAHRDLKPENLLFVNDTEDSILKLTDFGFAKEGDHQLTTPCCTPYYVAPEVLSNTAYDKACDIWSLGVIAYLLLCGYPPFYSSGDRLFSDGMKEKIRAGQYEFHPKYWNEISVEGKTMIEQMLIVDPTKRINIDEVLNSQWFAQRNSSKLIDLSSIEDENNSYQIQNACKFIFIEYLFIFKIKVSAANELQRRIDDEDFQMDTLRPETSKIEQRRAAKKKI